MGKVKVDKKLLSLYNLMSFLHLTLTHAPLAETLTFHMWESSFKGLIPAPIVHELDNLSDTIFMISFLYSVQRQRDVVGTKLDKESRNMVVWF